MASVNDESRGAQLRTLRKAKGLSLRAVATHLTEAGLPTTHQTVSNWENDQHPVPSPAVPVLEDLLSVDEGELAAVYGYTVGPSIPSRLKAIEERQEAQEQVLAEIRAELRSIAEALGPPPARRQGRRQ